MLGNAEQAIVAWNVVLQDNPGNVQALRALDRLYLTRGEFRELADNLQRQLNLVAADPAETVALLGRLGALREQHLGQLGGAVDTYSKILQIEPEHRETIAALERILPSPEHEVDVAMLLEPIYKIRGDWPRLIGVYEVEARHTVDPEAKIALYKQIAEGYEIGLDDPGTPTRRSRARWPRTRRTRRCRRASSVWPARCGGWTTWSPATASWSNRSPIRSGRTRSITRSRASPRRTWATT